MSWVGGLAEWTEGEVAYLSVAFTWKIEEAYQRATWFKALGYQVRIGGPALFQSKIRHRLGDIAELGGDYPDAVWRHNPDATIASRGCPVGCYFCIVPAMEGKTFTLLPDFPVRPILCDNNLSALPPDYQKYIISRYQREEISLLDANSGFEPATFNDEVFARWRVINKGPWRFAYDEQKERREVKVVMHMLRALPPKRKRVYVLIGNEPMASCLERLYEVIAWGGEPHAQPYIKLSASEKKPHVMHDWTAQKLGDVARWANRRSWRKAPRFEQYRRSAHSKRDLERYDARQGLFI